MYCGVVSAYFWIDLSVAMQKILYTEANFFVNRGIGTPWQIVFTLRRTYVKL